jgi:alpha-ketoglutarate-dependent taurine dioxygenase
MPTGIHEFGRAAGLRPFGLQIDALSPGQGLAALPGPRLRALVEESGLLVLRGFAPLSREAFVAYAATLGELYAWETGVVLELVAHAEPKNYLFATGSVPLHWDGAFRETAPSFQFFQCLRAPHPGTGGETQFCDTRRVLARASPRERALWEDVAITYSTDKVAHYGGTFTARLVSLHPRSGRPTLRLGLPADEETSPENPVQVEVQGMSPVEGARLVATLRERLYLPESCYVHAWRDGDFVIADNHALLHGRRPFSACSPRHLQRVHLC